MKQRRCISDGYVKKKTHYHGLICGIAERHRDRETIIFHTSGIIQKVDCKGCLKLLKRLTIF